MYLRRVLQKLCIFGKSISISPISVCYCISKSRKTRSSDVDQSESAIQGIDQSARDP